MTILYWHGYHLKRSGSNIFTYYIVREMAKKHRVILLSQEKDLPPDISENTAIKTISPDIGTLLPVFVPDRYQGFTAKIYPDLSDEELSAYISANAEAIRRSVLEESVDIVFANHIVTSPAIVKEALSGLSVRSVVVCHGSGLNYIVAKYPRFRKIAAEALESVDFVVGQSSYLIGRCKEVFSSEEITFSRWKVIPSGVDLNLFSKIPGDTVWDRLEEASSASAGWSDDDFTPFIGKEFRTPDLKNLKEFIDKEIVSGKNETIQRDLGKKIPLLKETSPTLFYVGRLIISKGIFIFLAALPQLFKQYPNLKVVIAGGGLLRGGCALLIDALQRGDAVTLNTLIDHGGIFEGEDSSPLPHLDSLRKTFSEGVYDRFPVERIAFTGVLPHDLLAPLLSTADLLAVPSIFAESFGMVVVEAMALGVMPVVFDHSGLSEAAPPGEEYRIPFEGDLLKNYTDKLLSALEISKEEKRPLLKSIVRKHDFSSIADDLVKLAACD